jgi:enamine deaminase RidA (YjgF/YER057c/UK114 family)
VSPRQTLRTEPFVRVGPATLPEAMGSIRRHDPFGGAYGAALAASAGDFVFSSVSGVSELRDGVPVFAETFPEQLTLAGQHLARELREFGLAPEDIVDAMVFVHPSVEVDPGLLLDLLTAHVFGEPAPAMTITRGASMYEASLVIIRVIAFRSTD